LKTVIGEISGMSTNTLTLNVPSPLYDQLKQLAAQTQRSVEEETLEALATAVPQGTSLSAELQDAMVSLVEQDDQTLLEAARNHLADDVSSELQSLHHKRQREGLSRVEVTRLADLVGQYERHMLVRAQAAALLKARGRDVSGLLNP
jgi:proline dehydrogenase